MSYFYESKLLCNHIYQYTLCNSKIGRDVKSIVLKLPSDQTISLRNNNEKQGSTACEILCNILHTLININLTFSILLMLTNLCIQSNSHN